ncbi:uncharacterized protein LOC130294952 [Hyla sarda]|uniref:uncharacterized protein LOC130294952 n=1 Tax=Hyla sarda TaxID=327740 RepID=UPI0024C3A189|nr:uncharacterized protein LOC130294952 [Hyla sarda]
MSNASDIEETLSVPETPARSSEQGVGTAYRSWTIPRLMEELRKKGIPFPASARKAELYKLMMSGEEASGSQQDISGQTVATSLAQLHNMMNSVMSSLSSLQSRMDTMEKGGASQASVPPTVVAAAAPATSAVAVPLGRGTTPPKITPSHFIPAAIRRDILDGKDVNLASLLISTQDVTETKTVACGEVSVVFKSKDARLNRKLTIVEFVIAFSLYRDVVCTAKPERREELDLYLYKLSEFAYKYGGSYFYEYHKSFAAKAAAGVSQFAYETDWSVVDTELYCKHFAGLKAPTCTICQSISHTAPWCSSIGQEPEPSTSRSIMASPAPGHKFSSAVDKLGRPVRFLGRSQVCNNYNLSSCNFSNCRLLHVCLLCFRAHPSSMCSQRSQQS